ncbi:MAG: hypothetical protein AABN95_15690 [Acidobacteriota bacterium]
MTDDRNSVEFNQPQDPSLPTPLFDANASASAQPVEPIRRSRISILRQKVGSLRSSMSSQSRALALVIIVGLTIGALGGLVLVNLARNSQQPAVLVAPSNDSAPEIRDAEAQKLDTFAAGLTGRSVQPSAPVITRTGKARTRWRTNRPRAYRVAVIR